MKRVLIAALVALFAVSFTMAQDQVAKKGKKAQTTMTQKKAGCCSEAKAADAKECAGMKDCADMKDCPAVKDTRMSKQGTTSKNEATKTAETKPADVK